jgi:hypothetical protein
MVTQVSEPSILEGAPPYSWKVGGVKIVFPVERCEEAGGNRIVRRPRPGRNGAKLDDTGSIEKMYTLTCTFFNGVTEEGVSANQYPRNLDAMIASFDKHETGTLTLSTKGPRRCRADTYRRIEAFEETDSAGAVFTFIEDSEDGVSAQSFTAPSARAVSASFAGAASNACEQAGAMSADIVSITEFAGELEGLANAPGDYVAAVQQKAQQIDSACNRIERAFTGAAPDVIGPAASLLSDPLSIGPLRALRALRAVALRLPGEATSGGPKLRTIKFGTEMNLLEVAARFGQDIAELIAINGSIPNLSSILPGTSINIQEAT